MYLFHWLPYKHFYCCNNWKYFTVYWSSLRVFFSDCFFFLGGCGLQIVYHLRYQKCFVKYFNLLRKINKVMILLVGGHPTHLMTPAGGRPPHPPDDSLLFPDSIMFLIILVNYLGCVLGWMVIIHSLSFLIILFM